MFDFTITPKPRNGALIADAEKAYKWSGVYPASCLPGIAPPAEGPRGHASCGLVLGWLPMQAHGSVPESPLVHI